jgi:hypothetical protein
MMITAALGSFALVLTGMALAPSAQRRSTTAARKAAAARDKVNVISSERLPAPISNA